MENIFIDLKPEHYKKASDFFKQHTISKYYKNSCYKDAVKILAKYFFLLEIYSGKKMKQFKTQFETDMLLLEKFIQKENSKTVLYIFKDIYIS